MPIAGGPTRVLILDDVASDAALVERELRHGGLEVITLCVETEPEFVAALADFKPDIVLSDYNLPTFNGMAALRLVQQRSPSIPVIIVTGTLDDETAAGCIRAGAADYVLKERLARLPMAVRSALERSRLEQDTRRAEEALRVSEAKYRGLHESLVDGYALVDMTGAIQEFNEPFRAMLGYEPAELEALTYEDVTPARWHDFERRLVTKQVMERGFSEVYEKEYRRKDGTVFPIELRTSLLMGPDGRPAGMWAIVRDITERKRAEEELRSARAFLDRIINAIADPVFVKDNKRRFVLVNDALCAIIGRPREGLLGEDGDDMFPKDQVAVFRQMDAKVLDTGEENANEETLSDLSSGEVHTIITRKTRYVDPAGNPFLVGVIRDITERKKLEEQLRHSQKMEAVGQLAGGVAHDFNNLLQAMLSLTQMLVGHVADPERLKADAAELEQQVRRGAALTRQLLLFSRRETVRLERLDLNEVVRDGLALLRRLLKAHVAIVAPLAEGQLPVEADRGQIGQVMINLAVNAGDAMPDGGRLAIETGSEGPTVWLKVADTGGGIPAAIRERIFEPFFTTKGLGKGTGLGLSVVHGIVTQHGGTVTFECQEGQGTTFTVTLPRAGSGEHPAVEIAERSGASQRGHGEQVLVVEDEESARRALAELLTILGYTVTAFGSGEEAGKLAPETPFDVLLTDLMLPGISGSELAIGLQARWPDLRVVLMSGYAEDEAIRITSGTGTVRFLQKPFDMDTLARELRAALDSSP